MDCTATLVHGGNAAEAGVAGCLMGFRDAMFVPLSPEWGQKHGPHVRPQQS